MSWCLSRFRAGDLVEVRSKEEILFRIQEHSFATVLENLGRLLEGEIDPEVRLRLLVENHLRFFVSNMKEMKVLSHEATALTGDARARVNSLKRRYTDLCIELLRQLRPDVETDRVRVASFALFGSMNWIYNWYRPGVDSPVEDLAADFTSLFLHGYMTHAKPSPTGKETAGPSIWSPSPGD